MNSKSQILTHNSVSSDNFDFNNEIIHCTSTNLMIHIFLDAPKIMDYENTIYSITLSQYFQPLCLFKDKHSEELNFSTLFYGQF
jgi:hypothetical protein